MKKILIVEDDNNLNRGISLRLEKEGYQVYPAFTKAEAEQIFKMEAVDMIICDITLPDGSGLEFGKAVREQSDVILLYLTALNQEIDIINGYDTGADDYMTKPFSLMVLISKVNALMHRVQNSGGMKYISGDIEVRIKDMQVTKNNEPVVLSKTELQLLLYLLKNAGKIASKENILEQVWGLDGQFVDDNTVAVNISRLKNKLGTDQISNVRGLGYIWTGQVKQL